MNKIYKRYWIYIQSCIKQLEEKSKAKKPLVSARDRDRRMVKEKQRIF